MIETIGIVGGGQLGRMLTEAALPLGFKTIVLDPNPECPAAQVGARQIEGPLNDAQAIHDLADRSDVVTWEIEHIDAAALTRLAINGYNIQPSPDTLQTIQDKYIQKRSLDAAGLPVVPAIHMGSYSHLESHADMLDAILGLLGGDVIIKTRTGGYDGRGNLVFDGSVETVENRFGSDWAGLYAERVVPFEREIAVIAARDTNGNIVTYPTVETVHEDNICHTVIYPPRLPDELLADAQEVAHETLRYLGGAGVFAIEMFATDNGGVLINEIAPRVHNSGHLTIEASVTSQFEQHIRAITGLPLGSTAMRTPAAVMINILGSRDEPLTRTGLDRLLLLPDTHPHFYGKSPRRARKIGHITVLGSSVDQALETAVQARKALDL